jgi:hypothetical protein
MFTDRRARRKLAENSNSRKAVEEMSPAFTPLTPILVRRTFLVGKSKNSCQNTTRLYVGFEKYRSHSQPRCLKSKQKIFVDWKIIRQFTEATNYHNKRGTVQRIEDNKCDKKENWISLHSVFLEKTRKIDDFSWNFSKNV